MKGANSTRGWAIVTGASSGFGREFARELAGRRYRVLAIARRREQLEALAKEIEGAGGRVELLVADLVTEQGLAAVVERLRSSQDIDLLINNAGLATGGDFLGASLNEELNEIRLNVDAVVRLTYEVLRVVVPKGRGAILNLGSVVAFQPFPHFAVYAASKAFVLSFTEAVAEETRGTGVRVLAVCPGAAKTEMEIFSRNTGLLGKLPSLTAEQVVKSALQALDHGRVVNVVGFFNRVLIFMNRFLPRAVVRWTMGIVAKPPNTHTQKQQGNRYR